MTIRHRQEIGLLPSKKLHYVDCTVLFAEEEKAIIRERGLGSHYLLVGPEVAPPAASHSSAARVLKALAPLLFLGGCVAGIGMTIAGNAGGGDATTATTFFAALGLYLSGIALQRHVRVAAQPEQQVALSRLLNNPTFSVYCRDNAHAKEVDGELRQMLARLKDGLLVNRDILAPETFEL